MFLTTLGLVGGAGGPEILNFNPRVGTVLTSTSTSNTTTSLLDVRLEPRPGFTLDEEEREGVAAFRAAFERQFGIQARREVVRQTLRVLSNRGNDKVVEYAQSSSGPDGTLLTFSFRQFTAPNGATRIELGEFNGPAQVRAVLQATLETRELQDIAAQGLRGLYGRPLVRGVPQTQRLSLDLAAFLGPLAGAGVGAGPVTAPGPLVFENVLTYEGRDANGRLVFANTGRLLRPASLRFGPAGQENELGFESLSSTGRATYRPDGLPAATNTTTEQVLRLTFSVSESAVAVVRVRVRQVVQVDAR